MRRTWADRLARATVVVHTTDGQSLRGVLADTTRDAVILTHAYALGTEGSAQSIDGEAVVPRSRVSWLQHLPATTEDRP